MIAEWSDDVVFFSHTTELSPADRERLEARGVVVVEGELARLVVEDDRLVGVETVDGRLVARSAVFVRPGNVPHLDGLLASLGCDLDAEGFPVLGAGGRTNVAGVWAAGNVADPRVRSSPLRAQARPRPSLSTQT